GAALARGLVDALDHLLLPVDPVQLHVASRDERRRAETSGDERRRAETSGDEKRRDYVALHASHSCFSFSHFSQLFVSKVSKEATHCIWNAAPHYNIH